MFCLFVLRRIKATGDTVAVTYNGGVDDDGDDDVGGNDFEDADVGGGDDLDAAAAAADDDDDDAHLSRDSPVDSISSLGSDSSTGILSLSQEMVGSGLPDTSQVRRATLSFSTDLSLGWARNFGKPSGMPGHGGEGREGDIWIRLCYGSQINARNELV